MDFRLLGPLEVAEHDRLLDLGGVKQRSLLAVLLLHANEVVASDRLIAELWDERPPATAAKSVHNYVSRLRKQLGDQRLVTRPPGYVLHVDPAIWTSTRFERLVAEARRAEPRTAAEKLRQGARAVARAAARRPRLRAVRADGDRPTGGDQAGGAGGALRRRPRRRTPQGARRGARGEHRRASAPGAPARAAHARALPLRPPGRGAPRLPDGPRASSPRSSASSRARS